MTKQKQKRPTHNWAVDQDYWDKLSEADRAWLKQFNGEYYYAGFTAKKKPIHPEYLRQDCNHRQYAMKNDAMTGAIPLNDQEACETSLVTSLGPKP